MIRPIAAVIAAVACIACPADEKGAEWSTAVATRPSDGHQIIHRFRSAYGPSFDRRAYSERVVIDWTYESDGGMPSRSEREAMDQMEDLMTPQVEHSGLASLAWVSTGEGLRRWIYYAKSRETFMARMNKALAGHPRFPVEVDLESDPRWERYEQLKGRVVR